MGVFGFDLLRMIGEHELSNWLRQIAFGENVCSIAVGLERKPPVNGFWKSYRCGRMHV
jgi:hypothetical protein